jgi:hypothetical protein
LHYIKEKGTGSIHFFHAQLLVQSISIALSQHLTAQLRSKRSVLPAQMDAVIASVAGNGCSLNLYVPIYTLLQKAHQK